MYENARECIKMHLAGRHKKCPNVLKRWGFLVWLK